MLMRRAAVSLCPSLQTEWHTEWFMYLFLWSSSRGVSPAVYLSLVLPPSQEQWKHTSAGHFTCQPAWHRPDSPSAGRATFPCRNVLLMCNLTCSTSQINVLPSCCLRLSSCRGQAQACSSQAPQPPASLTHVPRAENASLFFYCLRST